MLFSAATIYSTMDFRSINKFNVILNNLSGNFFPLSGEKTSLGFVRTAYNIFTWIIEAMFISTTTIGLILYIPPIEIIRSGGIVTPIVNAEIVILVTYLYSRYDHLLELVGKINSMLDDSDALKRCIQEAVDPHKKRLKIYIVSSAFSVGIWEALPLVKLLVGDQHSFNGTDFAVPYYFPGAPFGATGFFWGIMVELFGGVYCFLKKGGIDVYVSYLITLLSAEYRYLRHRMRDALSQVNDEKNEKLAITLLHKCVQHHCIAMKLGQMLTELLAVNIGLTYFNCILKLCGVGLSIATHPDMVDKVIWTMYLMSNLIQVYMFCLCGQELLDASTSVTEEAFHENWYGRGNSVKNIFYTVELGNRVKCQLSAFGIIDLTVPTFKLILSHTYSAVLLLMGTA